ncbi:MAG: hypothetical protein ACC645_17510, partial [Pirellulales bacterium]
MNRRTLLKWFCNAASVASAAVVVVPGFRFIVAPLRRKREGGAVVRRVVRLDQLPVGKPKRFSILGSRQDAWTVHA